MPEKKGGGGGSKPARGVGNGLWEPQSILQVAPRGRHFWGSQGYPLTVLRLTLRKGYRENGGYELFVNVVSKFCSENDMFVILMVHILRIKINKIHSLKYRVTAPKVI